MSAYVVIMYVVIVAVIVYITVRPIVRGTPVQAVVAGVVGVIAIGLVTAFVAMVTKS